MDLFSESRSLVYFGPVLRRGRSDTGFTTAWSELVAALLDNYCKPPQPFWFCPFVIYCFGIVILMREEKRPNGTVKRIVVSRVRIDFFILPL